MDQPQQPQNDPHDLRPKQSQYFNSDHFILRTFRFFNLLEPGRAVLSVSKLLLWIMTIFTIVCSLKYLEDPSNTGLAAMFASLTGFTTTLLNYGYRRWMAANNKECGKDQ